MLGVKTIVQGAHSESQVLLDMRGFLKLGVPLLGVSTIRIIVFWGLYGSPPTEENYHIDPKGPYYRILFLIFAGTKAEWPLCNPYIPRIPCLKP